MTTVPEVRYCQLDECRKQIPKFRSPRAKYCSDLHANRAASRRSNAKIRERKAAERRFDNPKYKQQKREGQLYEQILSDPALPYLLDGTLSAGAYAMKHDVTTAAVTRALAAVKENQVLADLQAGWQPSWRVRTLLPREAMLRLRETDPDSQEFHELLDHVALAYKAFSRWYFRLEGKRPLVEEFHLRWIKSIIKAWATGGKQLILSPPRHGKSEMLIRFAIWFIVMYPNIRIGWFCASRDVAELMLGAVKDHLENNEELIRDTLPPGEVFNPGLKSGKPWSKKEIKVAQQSHVGQKSSSLLALGLTSKFLSRDMDLIIIDDPEDFDSTMEAAQRKKARNKLGEIGTRKEEHTAQVFISSRQHPDDLGNHLLAMEGTPLSWSAIVDTAHSEDCTEDPDDWDAHYDCLLFPAVRSYRWLMEKKLEMEMLGIPHAYSMRYLNRPIPEDGQVFDVDRIREVALNRDRALGLDGLPLGHLVGGLDPSARGIQAAFLWHYRETGDAKMPVKMSMVDLDATRSGGVAGAVKVILDWYELYGVMVWYYETDGLLAEFYKLVKTEVAKVNPNIVIKPHHTGNVKMDVEAGISAMAPVYHSGAVDLPYGSSEARSKVNMLLRQLELWTTDGVQSKRALTDIKMAQWFPFVAKIQRLMREARVLKTDYAAESSYTDYDTTDAPWDDVVYPGM